MKRILTSIWFLGLFIAVPVIVFLPDVFAKYNLKEIHRRTNQNLNSIHISNLKVNYHDLNGDGKHEIIESFGFQKGDYKIHSIQYFSDNGGLFDQINFKGKYSTLISNIFFSDLNKNGLSEIYGFTTNHDSLFLNICEPFKKGENKSDQYFITIINRSSLHNLIDVIINESFTTDIDGDKYDEILFHVSGGYSLFPRKIFVFDYQTKTFLSTINMGNHNLNLQVIDISGDNIPEIIADGSASNNIPDSIPVFLDDKRPYLKIFSSKLELIVPPVVFPKGITSNTKTLITGERKKTIFTLFHSRSAETAPLILYKISSVGKIIDSLIFNSQERLFRTFFSLNDKQSFWVYNQKNQITLIDTNLIQLEYVRIKNIGNLNFVSQSFDFNEDNKKEFIGVDVESGTAYIFTDNFRRNYKLGNNLKFAVQVKLSKNRFFAYDDTYTYHFSFSKNPYFHFRIFIIILIYLIAVGVFWFLQKLQEIRIKEKYELQNQLNELELKNIQNQMDPHFMFNAFTTIASLLKKGEKEEAYRGFMKFSKLLRANFDFSQKLIRPLNEEILAVNNFLELNKMRFQDKLEYAFEVDETIPATMQVPKMMLQMHVENALKHGLTKLEKTGKIKIKITQTGKFAVFEIEDNGIGRKKSAALKRPSTKQGLKMLQVVYERINHKNKLNITQQFTDLYNEQGNAAGTRVVIKVPVDLHD